MVDQDSDLSEQIDLDLNDLIFADWFCNLRF